MSNYDWDPNSVFSYETQCIHCQSHLFFADRLGYWTDTIYDLGISAYKPICLSSPTLCHVPDMREVIRDLQRIEESLR
jgi:hypothetical protein